MFATQVGQYRCTCGWVLVPVPQVPTNIQCPNPDCENAGKQFVAPVVELIESQP